MHSTASQIQQCCRGYAKSAGRWSCCLIKRAALYLDDAESEEEQSSEGDSSSLHEEEGSASQASTGNSSLSSEDSDVEPIAISEDDVDRHNSNITAQELMEQRCPELLVGDLTPDLTDRYLYSTTL